jgi:hypothetical protein
MSFIQTIKDKLVGLITGPMIGRLIRHGLTVLVGILTASNFPGLADIGAFLVQHMDSLVVNLTASALGLLALIMSIKSDKK